VVNSNLGTVSELQRLILDMQTLKQTNKKWHIISNTAASLSMPAIDVDTSLIIVQAINKPRCLKKVKF